MSIKYKLTFIIIFSILFSFATLGFYFDSFLKKAYYNDAQTKIENTRTKIVQDIETKESSLKKGLDFIEQDEFILASISLINEYQDIQHYNKALLDEEKKALAQKLLERVKISFNSNIALYDKDGILSIFIDKDPKGYKLNFFSYEEGKMVLYSKYEYEENYHKASQTSIRANHILKHVTYYTQPELKNNTPITYHFFDNALFIVCHKRIFDANKTIAHIEMSNTITNDSLLHVANSPSISTSLQAKRLSLKQKKSGKQLNNLDQEGTIFQTENEYFTRLEIQAKNSDVAIVISLDKSILNKFLNENREDLLLFLVATLLFILLILYYLLKNSFTKPLDLLMQHILKIQHGDYSKFETMRSSDEFETTSQSINALADAINSRETKLLQTQKKLEFIANHDELTNLYNRRAFNGYLKDAIKNASNNGQTLALLFLDLDAFKQINDTLGHNIGDILLQNVATRVLSFVNGKGVLARKGGDEFQFFIENVEDKDRLLEFILQLLKLFEQSFTCKGFVISSAINIGIAYYPHDAKDEITLAKNADLAMYHAKTKGRNTYSFYTKVLSQKIEQRAQIIDAMRFALKSTEEFFLLYQPKISIKTGKIVGVEALVRWKSSTLGMMRPDEFIGIAEDTHMIIEIGKWVLNRACKDFMTLKKSGYPLRQMSVNLSAIQLQYSDFYATLLDAMDTSGIQSSELEMEITESYIATNAIEAIESLQQFRALGVELAIDDFGTGYSSMSYLQKLPVTRLKIDKAFVDDLPESKESVAVATAIMALASTFGLKITVEGVETLPQLEFFKDKYCDEIQGYFYSKPLDLESLKTFIQENLAN